MRGMYAVPILNHNYELIIEYYNFLHIKYVFTFFPTDSPSEIKLMKRGDGYVFA